MGAGGDGVGRGPGGVPRPGAPHAADNCSQAACGRLCRRKQIKYVHARPRSAPRPQRTRVQSAGFYALTSTDVGENSLGFKRSERVSGRVCGVARPRPARESHALLRCAVNRRHRGEVQPAHGYGPVGRPRPLLFNFYSFS
ncbi:hypothetical protein EVAR_20862_1 [Eumeta japonica]|uniref:Uncharacterized protein n=1 Tax=Eumeta variegata TaxID=151549 RepID=A0A4C1UEK2_EUMVA|nr:hypothetical protein EVAR_20862_1 [Eumeta japonica]